MKRPAVVVRDDGRIVPGDPRAAPSPRRARAPIRTGLTTPGARSGVLTAGIAGAVVLRATIGRPDVAESVPAAACMAVALVVLAVAAGWRPGAPRVLSLPVGLAGAAALVVVPAAARHAPPTWHAIDPSPGRLGWGIVLVLIVAGEEVVLRGVLFTALTAERGGPAAVAVTSLLFGLIHVPLYGWGAVPLDVAVGVWLAGLRLVTGGVAAPLTAHLGADIAAVWIASS